MRTLILLSLLVVTSLSFADIRRPPAPRVRAIKDCYNTPGYLKGQFVLGLSENLSDMAKLPLENFLKGLGFTNISKLELRNGDVWIIKAKNPNEVSKSQQTEQFKGLKKINGKQVLYIECAAIRRAL